MCFYILWLYYLLGLQLIMPITVNNNTNGAVGHRETARVRRVQKYDCSNA